MKSVLFRATFMTLFFLQQLTAFGQVAEPKMNIKTLDVFNLTPIQMNGEILPVDAPTIKLSEAYKGKWIILDLSATWCPYCKLDQYFFASHKNQVNDYTTNGTLWTADVVQVHLTIEYNKEGAFKQTKEIVRNFLTPRKIARDEYLKDLNRSNIDTVFVSTEDSEAFIQSKTKEGLSIFEGFIGFPYQLVFNPNGELVFQGQFTETTEEDGENWEWPYLRHYKMLTELIEAK